MPYQSTTYNVMIASPGDVVVERNTVRQVLNDWNIIHSKSRQIVLLPIGWETHSSPEMGDHPQNILNKQILQRSDLLVGVFWTRVGTPTSTYASGSVEEIEEHINTDKPAMLYFSNQPVRPDSVDQEQYSQLLLFRESCKKRGLFEQYENVADFREKFFRQLQIKLNEDSYFQNGNVLKGQNLDVSYEPTIPETSLSDEAKLLLVTAAAADGIVVRVSYLNGASVSAGKRNFVEGSDQRTAARWEAAVDELAGKNLIEDKAGERKIYFVTDKGFKVADRLPGLT